MYRKSSSSNPVDDGIIEKPTLSSQMSNQENKPISQHFRRLSNSMMNNIADFFGVGEENERNRIEWENRRLRYYNSIGKIKDDYLKMPQEDVVDSAPYKIPELFEYSSHHISLSSGSTGTSARKTYSRRKRKESVISLTLKGMTSLGSKKKHRKRQICTPNRSYAPASFYVDEESSQVLPQEDSIVDDVFYDEDFINSEKTLEQIPEEIVDEDIMYL